jgi:hypothetical protein
MKTRTLVSGMKRFAGIPKTRISNGKWVAPGSVSLLGLREMYMRFWENGLSWAVIFDR